MEAKCPLSPRFHGLVGSEAIRRRRKKMTLKTVGRASVLVLLLIVVSALSVCTEGGRELANKNVGKAHPAAASDQKGATASGDMVKTNDYGRYDPTPAFSKPRFKLIPN
ncbi:unnamed protein product [Urochloa decumbens]|uniref:Uncharacterized protein n=1 Tax=Urochloa decumbens TaxID=240449 RepID=A0ABC9AU35_9POAL